MRTQKSLAVAVFLTGILLLSAKSYMSTFWKSQTSQTSVSLTVVASGSVLSSSSSSSSTPPSSSSSSAPSSSSSSSSSIETFTPQPEPPGGPGGRYHYSEEETMKRLIPLLRKRFLKPSAPAIQNPPNTLIPYYPPLHTFPRTRIPSATEEVLWFGVTFNTGVQDMLRWPSVLWNQASRPDSSLTTFIPRIETTDENAWQWQQVLPDPFDSWDSSDVPPIEHAAAPQKSGSSPASMEWLAQRLGPNAEPWVWLFFLLVFLAIRKVLNRIPDILANAVLHIHRYLGSLEKASPALTTLPIIGIANKKQALDPESLSCP